jgi:hypothetical protein
VGKGQLKERCGLESQTNFFLFKKSPKTECGLDSRIYGNIQGDSGGKFNILGCDSIGHGEKKSSYEYVSNSEWLLRQKCLIYQYKCIVNDNRERKKLLTVNLIL